MKGVNQWQKGNFRGEGPVRADAVLLLPALACCLCSLPHRRKRLIVESLLHHHYQTHTMGTLSPADEAQLKAQLCAAVVACSDRGLYHASKWCAANPKLLFCMR